MDRDTLLKRLNLAGKPPPWAEDWDAAEEDRVPEVLGTDFVESRTHVIGMAHDLRAAMLDALPGLAADEMIRRLAGRLARRMQAVQPDFRKLAAEVTAWPRLRRETVGVEGVELLPAYLWLAGVPWLSRFYRDHGIPDTVFRDTLYDIDIWARHFRERNGGRWGLVQNTWLANHFSGNLFRIGRLQFQFGTNCYPYHAWRRGARGPVVLLADSGLHFSADGLAAGRKPADNLPIASRYEETDTRVSGLAVHPAGHVLPEPITLDRKEWHKVLGADNRVLHVHIPADGPMDFDACGESFRGALEFFGRHFPEYAWLAWTCGSWLMDPQFDGRLRESSNILRFLREFYLFPLPDATGDSHFERVFGTKEVDPKSAPRDTSLRRVLLEFVEAGGTWRAGGGVIFPDDFEWGTQTYRAAFAAMRKPGCCRE